MTEENRPEEPRGEEPTAEQPPTEERPSDEPTQRLENGEQHRERPRRLLRSRSDRMVAGVAGGLGRYFGVDPVIFRIAFGVSVFFGGLGIVAYLALAIFVPTGDGDQVDQAPYERSRWLGVAAGVALVLIVIPTIGFGFFWGGDWGWGPWGLLWLALPVAIALGAYAVVRDRRARGQLMSVGGVIAAIFLVAATVVGFAILAAVGAFATATGHGVLIAITVTVIGGLLILAGFAGGARWLIVPAAALATGVGVASAADLSFSGGIGQRHYTPTTVAAIPADGYKLGIGELQVDLRDLDWKREKSLELDVDLGVGQAIVAVPQNVCVDADLHTGAGQIKSAGEASDGADVDLDQNRGTSATPRLRLTGEVDLGEFVLVNDNHVDLDTFNPHHFGPHGFDIELDYRAQRAAMARACAR
jgi:phage shock protein PspC (stress-responsive transcriptional regulator)